MKGTPPTLLFLRKLLIRISSRLGNDENLNLSQQLHDHGYCHTHPRTVSHITLDCLRAGREQ